MRDAMKAAKKAGRLRESRIMSRKDFLKLIGFKTDKQAEKSVQKIEKDFLQKTMAPPQNLCKIMKVQRGHKTYLHDRAFRNEFSQFFD